MIVVRYADDTVVDFRYRSYAERFLGEQRTRMAEFDLELHPAAAARAARGKGKSDTFNFLGFTDICTNS